MRKFLRALARPFGKIVHRVPKPGRETVVMKAMLWSRTISFVLLAACPLILLYQLASWVEVRFWDDISIGGFIYPDPETAKQFTHGKMRILMDMLWIPLWFECLALAVILFATHMILWNKLDIKRQERRRARRVTEGTSSGVRRRSSR